MKSDTEKIGIIVGPIIHCSPVLTRTLLNFVKGSAEMKKLILTNVIIVISFILFDPLLNYLSKWADVYILGAEMVLGLLTPLLFGVFIILVLCLTAFSLIKCIAKKDVRQLIPITIFIIGVIGYMLISNSNSFWIRFVNYYINL